MKMNKNIGFFVGLLAICTKAQTIGYYEIGEEFCGPFSGWKNVCTDYGAKGDGVTNDGPAIQRALDEMKAVNVNSWNVLYFPAGTYRINNTLLTTRSNHNDYLGVNFIGEDPATTTISWNGPSGGVMFRADVWYSRISRLTFDGKSKAGNALTCAGSFSTGCEISDVVFKDIAGIAINLGNNEKEGIAEIAILRNKFFRCNEGISTINWNTLDVWVMHCLFEDCGVGILNRMGNYHAFGNVFLRSKISDIGSQNNCPFAVIENVSVGSKSFNNYKNEGWIGSPSLFKGNKIYNTTDTISIISAGSGSVFLDNIIRSRPEVKGPAAQIRNALAVGNTFTVGPWPMQGGYFYKFHGGLSPNSLIENVLDNDPNTRFLDENAGLDPNESSHNGPFVLVWHCPPGTREQVVKYVITHGSPQYSLKYFLFQGTNDWGSTWVTLDSQSNLRWESKQKREFTVNKPGSFKMYRFFSPVGSVAGVELLEIELLDSSGIDITERRYGLLKGRFEDFGRSYFLANSIVDASLLTVPEKIYLPSTPLHRSREVLEVVRGTGDDAEEIQKKVISACSVSAVNGTRVVVYIPKGKYTVEREIVVPANSDIQIVGDGWGNGTVLQATGDEFHGPVFRLNGPSKATVKDMSVDGGIVVENVDQRGGRIYCLHVGLTGIYQTSNHDVNGLFANGVEQSEIFVACGRFNNLGSIIRAKGGGTVSATRGSANGRIFLLGGGCSHSRLVGKVEDEGRIVAIALWNESYSTALELPLVDMTSSSGTLTISASHLNTANSSKEKPIVDIANFSGNLTIVGNQYSTFGTTSSDAHWIRISGSGSNTSFFHAFNDFVQYDAPVPISYLWQDNSSPPAKAVNWNCATTINELPNIVSKQYGVTIDSQFVMDALEDLRKTRIVPFTSINQNSESPVSDVKLIRVSITTRSRNGSALRLDAAPKMAEIDNSKRIQTLTRRRKIKRIIFSNRSAATYSYMPGAMIFDVKGRLVAKINSCSSNYMGNQHGLLLQARNRVEGISILIFPTAN